MAFICNKARKKLWILRRMVQLDLDFRTLFDIYTKEIRSLLELAVPVWHGSLTKQQSSDIERVQKLAFRIILGHTYFTYTSACEFFSTHTLSVRREKLCLKFARKNFQSENCLFSKIQTEVKTRTKLKLVQEYNCRTERFRNSSLPYLARLLNGNK